MTQKDFRAFFPGCFLAYVIFFFGMLTNHRLYIDDIGRSMRGYAWWWDLGGRPLADLFITIINLGTPLVNTFPLPQLISICILAVAGIYLAKAFAVESRLMAALCTLPLAGQPYYLENMSYSFDSPFMALSMLLCVCAAIQLFGKARYRLVYSIVMLFAALNLYQAPLGAFFVVCLFLMVKEAEAAPTPYTFWAFSIVRAGVAGGAATLLYIPVTKIPKLSAYVTQHGEMVGLGDGYVKIWDNIRFFFKILGDDWAGNAVGWVLLLLFALTVILAVRRVIRPCGDRNSFSLSAVGYATVAVVLLALTWIASYFPQYLLDQPQWSPRTFTGIGAIVSCCCLYCYSALRPAADCAASDTRRHLAALPVVITVFVLITFCYAFSKAGSEQKFYEDAILTRLVDDVEELSVGRQIKDISYIGRIGTNPVLLNSQKKFPLLARLVSMQIVNNWIWGYRQFTYAGITLGWRKITEEDQAYIFNQLSPLVEKTRYAIYIRDDQLVVHFRELK